MGVGDTLLCTRALARTVVSCLHAQYTPSPPRGHRRRIFAWSLALARSSTRTLNLAHSHSHTRLLQGHSTTRTRLAYTPPRRKPKPSSQTRAPAIVPLHAASRHDSQRRLFSAGYSWLRENYSSRVTPYQRQLAATTEAGPTLLIAPHRTRPRCLTGPALDLARCATLRVCRSRLPH